MFKNRDMLVVGRIISGISVGLASAVIPIYQSEITAPAIRGRMISLQQWYTHQSYLKLNAINLQDCLGLFHGVFSSNTSFNSVAHTSTGLHHSEFLGASKWFLLSSSVSECCFSLKVHVTYLIMDSESFISLLFRPLKSITLIFLSARVRRFEY